ncbi:hypothetical protein [Streptomyces syringium]|uniref:hypothetical protein n=1 Tax=Streptomyces syringium TaxID=76729 RepID=UPI0033FB1690
MEHSEIELSDDVEHLPAEVLWRQPLPYVSRHLTITYTVTQQKDALEAAGLGSPLITHRRKLRDSLPVLVHRFLNPLRRGRV